MTQAVASRGHPTIEGIHAYVLLSIRAVSSFRNRFEPAALTSARCRRCPGFLPTLLARLPPLQLFINRGSYKQLTKQLALPDTLDSVFLHLLPKNRS